MKRRVPREIRRRESRLVERDAEGFGEDGLGASHRTELVRKAATGAPVIAPGCVCTR